MTKDVPTSIDKARESLSELKDADDWDEPTGRTEVHVHVPPSPSKPDSDPIDLKKPNIKKLSAAITLTIISIGSLIAALKELFK